MTTLPEPPTRRMRNEQQFLSAVETWMRHLYEIVQVEGGVLERLTTLEAVRTKAKDVASLTQSVSSPPTQAEVQAIQATVNELLEAFD